MNKVSSQNLLMCHSRENGNLQYLKQDWFPREFIRCKSEWEWQFCLFDSRDSLIIFVENKRPDKKSHVRTKHEEPDMIIKAENIF